MEKIIYALWKTESMAAEIFNSRLHSRLAPALAAQVLRLRLNLRDEAVQGGTSPCFSAFNPSPDAVIQLWVNTAYPLARTGIDAAMAEHCGRYGAWLVCESTPLPNADYPPQPGERTPGFSQIAFVLRPPGMTHEAWRDAWQNFHTRLALDTQSTFEYVQNLVVRPLIHNGPEVWAIVEECFPAEALTDRTIYYASPGNLQGADKNEAAMMQSVARFIGENGCDVFPTSQFEVNEKS
jgi:hypothetical protein